MLVIRRFDKNYTQLILEADTESGRVRGLPAGNRISAVYKGIPFAAPPVGALRWKKPQPAEPWEGVRDCYRYGAAAYQLDRSYEECGPEMYPSTYDISEDCLCLNIWTPAKSTEDGLPVLFWTHGGGNFGGFSSELENDGEGLAKRGVILVTYNYRLNAFGFMAHPELTEESPEGVSGNYALYDAIAALRWVRNNIRAFGGDPERITIGGQSAGCRMTTCLMASPLTRGMYAGALLHSGVHVLRRPGAFFNALDLKEAEQLGLEFMRAHGCSNLAELRALPPEKIMEETAFEREKFMSMQQILDGQALVEDPAASFMNGGIDDVPVISLCTADEGKARDGSRQVITADSLAFCENQLSLGRKPVWAFRFSRALPGDDSGAWHTAELFYMFETIQRTRRPMTGYDFELQTRMADYWANFVKTGDPNGDGLPVWRPFTAENRRVMDLGTTDRMIDIR